MTDNSNNRALAVSQKVYGCLLRAYPPAHREAYGPAMTQLFRDQGRDAWIESQNWGLVKLWLRILPDLVNTSVTERLAAFNPRKSMSDKMIVLFRPLTSSLTGFFTVFTVVFLLVLLVSIAITFILPESYSSTARIKVESDISDITGINGTPNLGLYDPYFIQTTFEIIQSQLVLSNVITALNLNVKWGNKYFNNETLKTTETMEILKQRMQLAPVKNTKLIAITAYSEDRNEAAQIANAVAESYRDYRYQSRRELVETDTSALQKEVEQVEGKISQGRKELEMLRQQFNISNEAIRPRSVQENPYFEKKLAIDEAVVLQDQLQNKLAAVHVAAELPQTTMVQVIDRAEPGRAPVRPNKTLNIFIGVVAGGFLGLLAGGASALAAAKFGNRGRKNTAAL